MQFLISQHHMANSSMPQKLVSIIALDEDWFWTQHVFEPTMELT